MRQAKWCHECKLNVYWWNAVPSDTWYFTKTEYDHLAWSPGAIKAAHCSWLPVRKDSSGWVKSIGQIPPVISSACVCVCVCACVSCVTAQCTCVLLCVVLCDNNKRLWLWLISQSYSISQVWFPLRLCAWCCGTALVTQKLHQVPLVILVWTLE